MKLIPLIVALALLAVPAIAQNMTDFQSGVQQGLYVGLKMGQLLGQAQAGNTTAANVYNGYLQKYHSGLQQIFGTDPALLQQMMAIYQLPPLSQSLPSYQTSTGTGSPIQITNSSWKPIHKFDASFNHSNPALTPDAEGRIHGMPADAYYMWAPSDMVETIRNGGVIDPMSGV